MWSFAFSLYPEIPIAYLINLVCKNIISVDAGLFLIVHAFCKKVVNTMASSKDYSPLP
jgi:hypothetical protein